MYQDVMYKAFMDELTKLAGASEVGSAASGMFSKLWKNKKTVGLVAAGAGGHALAQDTYKKYKMGSDMIAAQQQAEEQMQG